ncbi:hypothetical protein GCM10027596_41160 [Nocardioides korecus]
MARYDAVPRGAAGLQSLAEEAARMAAVPFAAVNLLKSSTQRTVAAVGVELSVLDARDTMCAVVVAEGRSVHVRDAAQDERWAHKPFVDGRWANIRFYGAHPLVSPDQVVVGTLCVMDTRPRELTSAQITGLDALAGRAVRVLEQERLNVLHGGFCHETGSSETG